MTVSVFPLFAIYSEPLFIYSSHFRDISQWWSEQMDSKQAWCCCCGNRVRERQYLPQARHLQQNLVYSELSPNQQIHISYGGGGVLLILFFLIIFMSMCPQSYQYFFWFLPFYILEWGQNNKHIFIRVMTSLGILTPVFLSISFYLQVKLKVLLYVQKCILIISLRY